MGVSPSVRNRLDSGGGRCADPGYASYFMAAVNATWPHPNHIYMCVSSANRLSHEGRWVLTSADQLRGVCACLMARSSNAAASGVFLAIQ